MSLSHKQILYILWTKHKAWKQKRFIKQRECGLVGFFPTLSKQDLPLKNTSDKYNHALIKMCERETLKAKVLLR